ncbi:hypothetical protein GGR21_003607 [Dysgonomonas hofstadii]|uniref:Uncharacterized protein n=1 Tax=Dysgonomonas hofstadii TaxID=637886 RepID=A0A840CQI0_9BACT|nr:hypothetical protein [Dysgonomonas hofstadii]
MVRLLRAFVSKCLKYIGKRVKQITGECKSTLSGYLHDH